MRSPRDNSIIVFMWGVWVKPTLPGDSSARAPGGDIPGPGRLTTGNTISRLKLHIIIRDSTGGYLNYLSCSLKFIYLFQINSFNRSRSLCRSLECSVVSLSEWQFCHTLDLWSLFHGNHWILLFDEISACIMGNFCWPQPSALYKEGNTCARMHWAVQPMWRFHIDKSRICH